VYVLLEFWQKIMAIPIMNPLSWFMIRLLPFYPKALLSPKSYWVRVIWVILYSKRECLIKVRHERVEGQWSHFLACYHHSKNTKNLLRISRSKQVIESIFLPANVVQSSHTKIN